MSSSLVASSCESLAKSVKQVSIALCYRELVPLMWAKVRLRYTRSETQQVACRPRALEVENLENFVTRQTTRTPFGKKEKGKRRASPLLSLPVGLSKHCYRHDGQQQLVLVS